MLRLYVKYDNKDIQIDEITINSMTANYFRIPQRIIRENDDAETVATKLKNLKTAIKKEYLGGE